MFFFLSPINIGSGSDFPITKLSATLPELGICNRFSRFVTGRQIITGSQMGDVSERGRKILVAVDESEESLYALSWCLKNVISQNSKDTLILLYARPTRPIYTAMDGTGYLFSADIMATMERYSRDMAEAIVEKAKKLCKDLNNVKVETRVESGDARDVICEMVEKLGADVLVMGSHGYGPIKRAFIGSVSNHCAKIVKCPILIVKKPKDSPPATILYN